MEKYVASFQWEKPHVRLSAGVIHSEGSLNKVWLKPSRKKYLQPPTLQPKQREEKCVHVLFALETYPRLTCVSWVSPPFRDTKKKGKISRSHHRSHTTRMLNVKICNTDNHCESCKCLKLDVVAQGFIPFSYITFYVKQVRGIWTISHWYICVVCNGHLINYTVHIILFFKWVNECKLLFVSRYYHGNQSSWDWLRNNAVVFTWKKWMKSLIPSIAWNRSHHVGKLVAPVLRRLWLNPTKEHKYQVNSK